MPEVDAAPESDRVHALGRHLDARAAAAFNALRQGPDWLVQRPVAVPGLEDAILMLMVKDEQEILTQNLEHHYHLGFRRFFILDNASTDRTADLIDTFRAKFPDAGVFSAYDYVVGHYQAAKMQALCVFAASYLRYEDTPPSWVFFVDADEFIVCTTRYGDDARNAFAALLADPEIKLISMHWAQCTSPSIVQSLPEEYDIFDVFPSVWSSMKVPVSKIAFRLETGMRTIQGNHTVEQYPFFARNAAVLGETGYSMFHFPNRTIAQLRRKLINGAKALSATKDRDGLSNTAGHWREYYKWYQEHGDAALEAILKDAIAGSS